MTVTRGDVRQAARRRAAEGQRRHQALVSERDSRIRVHVEAVLIALAERDEVVRDRERAAGDALLALSRNERLTVGEMVSWCGGELTAREATRLLRQARANPSDDDQASDGSAEPEVARPESAQDRDRGAVR